MPLVHGAPGPLGGWDFHIFREATWNEPLPRFKDAEENDYDLTGVDIQLWIRPAWSSDDLFLYCSVVNGLILVDSAVDGTATIYVSQGTVEANIPTGRWKWHMRFEEGSDQLEVARGNFYCHGGED